MAILQTYHTKNISEGYSVVNIKNIRRNAGGLEEAQFRFFFTPWGHMEGPGHVVVLHREAEFWRDSQVHKSAGYSGVLAGFFG